MNSGKTIFARLVDFIARSEFRRCVTRCDGNYKIKSFSGWDRFLTMAFAQLTYRESLRDIESCLRVQPTELYHMGIPSPGSEQHMRSDRVNRPGRSHTFSTALCRAATVQFGSRQK